MSTRNLLGELREQGIEIWIDGDQLNARAPKGVLTQNLRDELTRNKESILNLLREQQSKNGELTPSLPASHPEERYLPFPLNDMQQAYWLGRSSALELTGVGAHTYLEFDTYDLEIDRLMAAWQKVVERHDMLRAIVNENGTQQILQHVPHYQIEVSDLRGQSYAARSAHLEDVRQRLSHQVFAIDQWPLFEIQITRLDERLMRVHFSMDLTVADAPSLTLLCTDWANFYHNEDASSEPPEFSFRDYVLAERAQQQTDAFRKAEEYWSERVATLPAAPELPMVKDLSSLAAPRFLRRKASLDPELWSMLKARAAEAGLSFSGVLLAAFAEVLGMWSRNSQFTINIALINRIPFHEQVADLIGVFSSLSLLAVEPARDSSFEERARAIQDQLWTDLEHGRVNGVRVLRELARQRGTGLKAQMPVVFTSTLLDASKADWLGEIVYSISQTPQVWLDLQVLERAGALIYQWDAVEELFDEGMLDDLFGAYSRLLQRLAEEEEAWGQRDLELLPASQVQERRAANMTAQAEVSEQVQEAFLAQAAAHPEQVALISDGQELSYGELARQAAQLAEVLRQHGAGANGLVGILEEKGVGQVVAVLGTLMSGAAYLPLDPENPELRWGRLLEQAQVQLLITERGDDEPWWPAGVQRISLAEVSRGPEPAANWRELAATGQGEDLAYVMYTSGSTGQPKGVMVNHRGLVNALAWSREHFGLSRADKAIAITGLHHDMSVFDVLGVLGAGGTLVIPEGWAKLEARRWVELLREHEVTIWNSVPAYMQMLVQYLEQEQEEPGPGSLRLVIMGGDWIGVKLPEQIWRQWPKAQVVSVGGPTETTLWNIYHEVGAEESAARSILYGKPIANNRYYILDELLRERPAGVVGEMYCGGVGVSPGYWQDEERSRERFIRHPESGERLYRTGDLGRYVSGGEIEFIGRADDQVQVGGYRVEPGEVEAVLVQQGGAQAAAVVAVGEERGHKQLVAYVVMGTAAEGEEREAEWSAELQRVVSEWLPGVMTPRRYVYVEELPLTANGKVDRGELGRRALAGRAERGGNEEPSSALEKEVAGIWEEVLGVSGVKLDDNFLELGGHSVLAMQVVTRVRAATGTELSLRQLFEGPTVRELAAALAAAQAAAGSGAAATPKIERLERTEATELPLSFAQQRLWFLDQLEPDNPSYTMPGAICLSGQLNIKALEDSLNEVVRRHEILRTSFASVGGKPSQVIAPTLVHSLPVFDLENIPDNETEAFERARALARQPFNMAEAPLWRSVLLRLAEDKHWLLFAAHHIIADGWSFGVIVSELAVLYDAFSASLPSPLPEPPLQYVDFAHWQREMLMGETLETQVTYWKKQLAGSPPVLQLPTDNTAPAISSYRGERQFLVFPQALSKALADLSQQEDVTLFMLLLAAFKVLLARYSGQEDISVGSPIANRSQSETESMVGYFANNLVLRTDLSGNPTFSEVLKRVREVAIGAYAHQDVPFEKLVEVLQPERGLSRNPLFQVMFAYQNQPGPTLHLRDLTITSKEVNRDAAMFDMVLCLWERPEGLSGWLEYDIDLFDPATATRMVENLQTLLESIVVDRSRRIQEIPLLTPAQSRQLLGEWNATTKPYSRAECLHQIFEQQVERTPNAIAAVFEGQTITYSELNKRANQLAHHLKTLGIGRGALVGVYMERSLEILPALYGILKAGGAYVPLETTYPAERIEYILSSLASPCLLTLSDQWQEISGLQDRLPALGHVICLDEPNLETPASPDSGTIVWTSSCLDDLPEENLHVTVDSTDLAYIIFTSGSTGTPKGVMVQHQPVINLIEWVNQTFNVNSKDRLLFITSLCFDLSVYDIFGILAAGGSIHIATSAETQDPELLLATLCDEPITFWDSAPAALQQLTAYFDSETFAHGRENLRLVFLSGDWIPVTLPDAVRSAFPNAQVIGLGGATEATIWSNFYPVGHVPPEWVSIPYGKPIQNASYYILNSCLEPCPVGVPGDLYIGGECLCSGYANEPELTASKFLPDPFGGQPGSRIYRTGDLARFFRDGNIEFLGRIDHQVKIRGFRIELGEVESSLAQHPGVRESVVMAWGEKRGEKTLVAYVVPTAEGGPTVTDLRTFLRDKLPEYMVPSFFLMLDQIPLTANGKVDRRALPAPDNARPGLEESFVEPRTPIEKALVEIWTDVLGIKRIGVNDSFFDLGGHSMLATQLVSRARQAFKVNFPLQRLFSAPTIFSMALTIEEAMIAEMEDLPEAVAQMLTGL